MKKILHDLNLTEKDVRNILTYKTRKKPRVLKRHLSDKILKFGIVSDTHLCSKKEKINQLFTFYSICKKMGIEIVLHAGDMLSGWGVYKGQQNEVHTFGAVGQVDYAVANYPRIKGVTTYFIDGNHDESWHKIAGIQTGELIGQKREDMVYLGQYSADVILSGTRIRLHHGDGGGAYALSYKGQKLAESIPSGQKPRVFILGHYHTAHYFWYRNMHIINAGCFEDQTLFLLRKGLNPAIGGWLVELRLGEKPNDILACQTSWIPFL